MAVAANEENGSSGRPCVRDGIRSRPFRNRRATVGLCNAKDNSEAITASRLTPGNPEN